MNIKELKDKLEKLGIDEKDYNLDNRPKGTFQMGIERKGEKWEVFQTTERGGVNIVESFDKEKDACKLVLDYLVMRKKQKERWERS